MALNKNESTQHAIQDGFQRRNVIWTPFMRWPSSFFFFFQNMQSILNCIILSSYICKPICCLYYPPTKSEGYSFGVVRASVRPFRPSVRPSVRTFCLSGTISQYLLVGFDSFLVQMISTMDFRYPISLVKIDPLTLELLPLF